MGKGLLTGIMVLMLATSAHAGIDNSVNNSSKSKAIAKGGSAHQGQLQGQIGINKQSAVGQGNSTNTTVEGDEVDVLSLTIPATPSTQGKVEQSIGSPWGYINKNTPSGGERIEWYSNFTGALRDSGHMTDEEYLEAVNDMKKAAKKYLKGSKMSKIPVLGLLAN